MEFEPLLVRAFRSFVMAMFATTIVCPSAAAPLPKLVVVRAPEANDCPDAPALATAVENQMQRPALDLTSDASLTTTYEVQIARSADGYEASIRSGDFIRNLTAPGSSCTELSDALALTLAILLDNEASNAEIVDVPAPPAELSPPVELPLPAELPLPPDVPALLLRQTPPRQTVRLAKPTRTWGLGLTGGIAETVGFLAPFSVAWSGGVWFRYQTVSVRTGVFAIPSLVIDTKGPGVVETNLVTGHLRGCRQFPVKLPYFHFAFCGESFVGSVHAEGRQFSQNRAGNKPWVALGAGLSFQGPLVGPLAWALHGALVVPVVSQRFTAHPTDAPAVTLFEPPKIAGLLSFDILLSIL